MELTKLCPSRNTEERLRSGLPIDRAYIAGRIALAYAVLADCGIFVETMHGAQGHADWSWLQKELCDVDAAISVVRKDLADKGDVL